MNDLPGRGFGAQLSSGRGAAAPSVAVFYAPACIFCHRPQPAPPLLAGAPSARQHIAMLPPPFLTTRRTARGGVVVIRIPLFALALGAFVGVAGASAQQRQITGQVTSSATREPMAGVNVAVTGTAFAAVSNADGRYAISAPAGAVTLVFRHIAFKRREVAVAPDQSTVDATLEPDVFNLEAVVVTGQATGIEQRNAAIANTVVTAAEVAAAPAPALDRALQGRVPGAYIQQNSGAPGGGTQVQIRGSNTVIGSSNPLYVVDGVIVSDASVSTGLFSVTASGNPQSTRNDGEKQDDPVNRLTDLNPNDVESVQVLRGAAASSIYGSKGVNGRMIITTKRGRCRVTPAPSARACAPMWSRTSPIGSARRSRRRSAAPPRNAASPTMTTRARASPTRSPTSRASCPSCPPAESIQRRPLATSGPTRCRRRRSGATTKRRCGSQIGRAHV